jgi:NAD(P)-dependent dehydrogenase (short-subunit alcohol dehydrogenase family)
MSGRDREGAHLDKLSRALLRLHKALLDDERLSFGDMAKSRGVEPSVVEREFFETVRPSSLLKWFGTSDEVAALVTFIASPLSSATNGAALRVDGGVVRSIF